MPTSSNSNNLLLARSLCYNKPMTSGGKSPSLNWRRWLDEWRLAFSGVLLATRERRFIIAALVSFVFFGTLMHLLAGGTAAFSLLASADLSGKLKILADGFLANFGVGQNFWDWLFIFVVTVLQSILIGLVALVWHKRRHPADPTAAKTTPATPKSSTKPTPSAQAAKVAQAASNADNLQSAGLAAGLAVLGTGCPTCGTTLLMPVIGTLFSTSGYALAGFVSGLLTAASLLIALFALKRVSHEAYALIVSERFLRRHQTQTRHQAQSEPQAKTQPQAHIPTRRKANPTQEGTKAK